MDNPLRSDLQSLWQNQPVVPRRFSAEEVRGQATRFQRRIRLRNLREYVAAIFVLVMFGIEAWRATSWLTKAGPVLIIFGTLYIVRQLYTHAASAPVPGAAGGAGFAESCLRFHRRELERQRDLLRTVWRWYLGPLVPGFVVMLFERFSVARTAGGHAMLAALGSASITVLVLVGVGWLNSAGAKKLDREIDALGTEPREERT